MRYDSIYISGLGSWMAPPSHTASAAAQGIYPPEVAAAAAIRAVAISSGEAAPEMAVRAAKLAVARAACDPDDIGLLVYANSCYQGYEGWTAAPYLQRVAVGTHNPSLCLEIHQLSNGGMAALDLAAAYLAGSGRRSALIIAAERFSLPTYDRWRSERGSPLGDGASALVLSRQGGIARLRCVVSWTEPELEGAHRGPDGFGLAPLTTRQPLDSTASREAFIARIGRDNWDRLSEHGRRSALWYALDEAGLRLEQIDRFVLPNMGLGRLSAEYLMPLGIEVTRTAWPTWGRDVGHIGAADHFAGLEHLVDTGRLLPGQFCLMMGSGGDCTWTCAVLEVLDRPSWAVPEPARR